MTKIVQTALNIDLNSIEVCSLSGSNYDKSALVEVVAWYQVDNKPLLQPMMTQFSDAYMCHKVSMC